MCDELNFLRLIYYLKFILEIIYIIVPIALIIMLSVDILKMVFSSDGVDKKRIPFIIKRTISGAAIFFVPALGFYLVGLVGVNGSQDGIICWKKANSANIDVLQAKKDLEDEIRRKAKEEEKKKKEEEKKQEENKQNIKGVPVSKSYKPFVNGVQRNVEKGECMKKEDNCYCPTVGSHAGFQFTLESETGRNFNWTNRSDKMVRVSVTCSDGSVIARSVNENAKSEFEQAFKKLCQIRTTGINGIKINTNNLFVDGTYVERLNSARTVCSPHAYGYAIDLNYNSEVKVNGKTYRPWAGQGPNTKKEYDAFVKAIGRENDIRNVNYIVWKYAFEPSGFSWGGNWSTSSFDPMHYEVE